MVQAKKLKPAEAAQVFHASGWLSIWVGQFDEEDDLEDYMAEDFEKDVGYKIRTGLEPFADLAPADARSVFEAFPTLKKKKPKLLKRLDQALSAMKPKAIVNAVILQDHFRYDPAQVKGRLKSRVTFVGAFRDD